MLQSCIEFDGRFGPQYPLKPGVSRGPLGLSGGQALLGPRNSTTDLSSFLQLRPKQKKKQSCH